MTAFQFVVDGLSSCKTRPFTLQKVTFCTAFDGKRRREIWCFDVTFCASSTYVCRLKTALFPSNGVPLFTKGYAVVTDISETINVTLTWGNVDNFQPLFDNNLRDLTEEMEGLNAGHIDWNESSTILDANTEHEYPGVAFWGVNFGMGLSNPQYVHPSVQVSTILQAIERQHDITIDGKERLAYSPNLGPIVPLVSNNGDEVSNETEAFIGRVGYQGDFGIIVVSSETQNPRKITTPGSQYIVKFDGTNIKTLFMDITGTSGSGRFYVRIAYPIDNTIRLVVFTTSESNEEVILLDVESEQVIKQNDVGEYYFDQQHRVHGVSMLEYHIDHGN